MLMKKICISVILLLVSLFSCKKEDEKIKPEPALQPEAYEKILDTVLKTQIYDIEISNEGMVMLNTANKERDLFWLFYKIEKNQLIANNPRKSYETPYNQTFVNSSFTRKIQTLDFKKLKTFDFIDGDWKKIGEQELIEKRGKQWIYRRVYLSKDGQKFYLFQYNLFADIKLTLYKWEENKWVYETRHYITSFNNLAISKSSFSQTPNGEIFVKTFGKYDAKGYKYGILYFDETDYKKRQAIEIKDDSISGSPIISISPSASRVATIFYDYKKDQNVIQIFQPEATKYSQFEWSPSHKIYVDKQTSSTLNLKFTDDNTLFFHDYTGLIIYKFIDEKWQKFWKYYPQGNGVYSCDISEDGSHIFLKADGRVIAFRLKENI